MKEHANDGGAAAHTIEGKCSVEYAIGVIGGKWKLFIIRLLLYQGPQRYNELLRAIPGISNKVLTENLRELEAAKVAVREGDGAGSQQYGLTTKGAALLPLLKGLGDWAMQHDGPEVERLAESG
jgi:DNA-binding HxlR family transcriptional regulator